MDVETTDFSIEKIISDIDKDLSFNDVTNVDEDSGLVVYKKLADEKGDPVMVMQINPPSSSDEDEESRKKTSSKNEENCSTNGSILGDNEMIGETVNSGKNKISLKKGEDDETVRDVVKNKKSPRKGDNASLDDETVGDGLKNKTSPRKGETDNSVGEEQDGGSDTRRDLIGTENNGTVEEDCIFQVTRNADVSSSDNELDDAEPNTVNKTSLSKATTPLQAVSVLIEKLDYNSVSKSGVSNKRNEHTDSDGTVKCKKNPFAKRKMFNKLNSRSQKGKSSFDKSIGEEGLSKVHTRRRRCIICFLSVDLADFDEHVAAHKAVMIASNSQSTHRNKSESTDSKTTKNPGNKRQALETVSRRSKVKIDMDSNCSVESVKKNQSKLSRGNETKRTGGKKSLDCSDSSKVQKITPKTKAVAKSKESFDCDECKKSFLSSRDLRHHKMDHREGEKGDKSVENKSVDDKLQCDLCQKTFVLKQRLAQHIVMAHRFAEHKSAGSRKRKSETPEAERPGKTSRNSGVSSRLSKQDVRASQPFQSTPSTGLASRAPRTARSSEPLVILPFTNVGSLKGVTAGSSTDNPGAQFPDQINISSLGSPREVRRETVRKYHRCGSFGDEEITETITEIW